MIKHDAIPKHYTLCQIGDVAFADASEDTGEIGKSVELVDTIESDTICGLHTIHGRDVKNRTIVGFKGLLLILAIFIIKSNDWHKVQKYFQLLQTIFLLVMSISLILIHKKL